MHTKWHDALHAASSHLEPEIARCMQPLTFYLQNNLFSVCLCGTEWQSFECNFMIVDSRIETLMNILLKFLLITAIHIRVAQLNRAVIKTAHFDRAAIEMRRAPCLGCGSCFICDTRLGKCLLPKGMGISLQHEFATLDASSTARGAAAKSFNAVCNDR